MNSERLTEILSDLAGRYAYIRSLVQLMQAHEHTGKELESIMTDATRAAWADFRVKMMENALEEISNYLSRQNEAERAKLN